MVSGGWWVVNGNSGKDKAYIQSGSGVRNLLSSSPEVQRRLGWSSRSKLEAGAGRFPDFTVNSHNLDTDHHCYRHHQACPKKETETVHLGAVGI